MPYQNYQQVASSSSVKDSSAFNVTDPSVRKCQLVELQADTNHIRYTMDGSNPTTTVGMALLTTEPPRAFLMEDFLRIKFIQNSVGAGNLNAQFYQGRNV